ncbi:CAP domain-containing protein [Celeribacter sp.]|uniref:CAP domain-containing protein n=1 Tax=Celeribacter sp. TaxID=1890673 RepID=UPI003A8ED547
MTGFKRSVALVAFVCVAGCSAPAPVGVLGESNGASSVQAGNAKATETARVILAEINAERAAKGLGALQTNPRLSAAAQAHAEDMAARGYFSHVSKDGSTPKIRAERAGYRACLIAENISRGYPSAQQAVAGWMASKGHRENILRRGVSQIGIGIGAGRTYVTVFADPC